MNIMPWHAELVETISDLEKRDALPHAVMLSGGEGLGVDVLAHTLARALLCESPASGYPCGQCKACHLMEAGSHNDFMSLELEEDAKQIKISQVRSLVDFVSESSMRGGHKVAVINPVEDLNIAGSNALLKTLEEPAGDTIIFLVAQRQEAVLATIRSRCQILNIQPPSHEDALSWLMQSLPAADSDVVHSCLSISNGEPVTAMRFIEQDAWGQQKTMIEGLGAAVKRKKTVSDLAESWADDYLQDRLVWLIQWIEQMIRFSSTEDESVFLNADSVAMLKYLAGKAGFSVLFELREAHLV
ncbi:hypothetical protein A3715_25075, partial [Oleiphilus sp. HI0009]